VQLLVKEEFYVIKMHGTTIKRYKIYVSSFLNMSANILAQVYDENTDTYIKNAVAYWPTV